MDHPADEVLARIADGALKAEGELAEHLRGCATCTEVLSALMRARTGGALEDTARSPRRSNGAPRVHERIGRYRVERLLGEGAMGQVFEALDPELNRRVAVKVVRGTSNAELRGRLLREAQAAARLRHPNVVTVHDAGTIDDEVFIAMESVPGGSVRGWLNKPKGWREVVQVFIGAGRGLAAVHDAGLVHRDFKPDNVLLDSDGTARVSDFGLVGAEPGAASTDGKDVLETDGLTRSGMLMGTPAYMSPELFTGAAATPKSDQFAFCVSLFEGLAGERPFRASTLAELKSAVRSGKMRELPSHVPGWLARLVRRGLSIDPSLRFASMHELVGLLESTPVQQRRRRLGLLGALGVTVLVAGSAFVASGSDARRCRQGAARVDKVWTPERRAALSAHVLSIPSPLAKDTERAVTEAFDTFARDWRAMHLDACEATRVRGEQSDQLLDLRVQCLEARLTTMSAGISTLEQLTKDELENAQRVVRLGGLAACADTKSLANTTPPPAAPDEHEKLLAIRASLADVTAQTELGRAKSVLPAAEKAVADAKALGWRPLEADALLALATAKERSGDPVAGKLFSEAALAAEAGRSDPTLVSALGQLAAEKLDNDPKEARELLRRTRAVLERLHDDDLTARIDLTEASLFIAEATPEKAVELMDALLARRTKKGDHIDLVARERRAEALNALGKLKESLEAYEEVAKGREQLNGRQHPLSLVALKNVAAMKDALSDFDGARAVLEDVLARSKENFGDDHPTVARSLVNLGNSWFHQGKSKEAAPLYERAIAIFDKDPEPSMPKAIAMGNLASAYSDLRRLDDALALQRRSLEMLEKIYGPEHPEVAYAMTSLANTQRSYQQLPEALVTCEKALEIQRKVLPKNHPDTAYTLFLLADMRNKANLAPDKVFPPAEEALEMFRATVGPDGNQTVAAESFIASLNLRLGKAADALPVFERVQKLYDARGNASSESALNHLNLAKALIATKGPKARICAEADLSLQQYAAAGERDEELAILEKMKRTTGCASK